MTIYTSITHDILGVTTVMFGILEIISVILVSSVKHTFTINPGILAKFIDIAETNTVINSNIRDMPKTGPAIKLDNKKFVGIVLKL